MPGTELDNKQELSLALAAPGHSCAPLTDAKIGSEQCSNLPSSYHKPGAGIWESLSHHFSLSCTGEGNGNPLQCSCLENPRDGGAWWAAVHGVAPSRTRLKRLSSSSHHHLPVFKSFHHSKTLSHAHSWQIPAPLPSPGQLLFCLLSPQSCLFWIFNVICNLLHLASFVQCNVFWSSCSAAA